MSKHKPMDDVTKRMFLEDVLETCIDYEKRIHRMRLAIYGLATLCAVLLTIVIGGML